MSSDTPKNNLTSISPAKSSNDKANHAAWNAFIRYCIELDYGEIEVLKIQHGLPVMAEITRKKVKFQ